MDVGNLFQLERSLQGYGIVDAAPEKEKILRFRIPLRQILNGFIVPQNCFQLAGNLEQLGDQFLALLLCDSSADLRQIQGEQYQSSKLRCERLGGSYSNFRTCVCVN